MERDEATKMTICKPFSLSAAAALLERERGIWIMKRYEVACLMSARHQPASRSCREKQNSMHNSALRGGFSEIIFSRLSHCDDAALRGRWKPHTHTHAEINSWLTAQERGKFIFDQKQWPIIHLSAHIPRARERNYLCTIATRTWDGKKAGRCHIWNFIWLLVV